MIAASIPLSLSASWPAFAAAKAMAQDLPGVLDIAPLAPQPAPPTEGFPHLRGRILVITFDPSGVSDR